ANLMGGFVGCDSEAGYGAAFWLDLPCTFQGTSNSSRKFSCNKLKILAVDDNASSLAALSRLVHGWGGELVSTLDASSFTSQLLSAQDEGSPFDIAMIDVSMPDMDGFSLCEAIRKHRELANLPLVLMRNISTYVSREAEDTYDITATITKPFRQATLFRALDALGSVEKVEWNHRTRAIRKKQRIEEFHGNVLIVDDDRINRFVLEQFLTNLGAKCQQARQGYEAIEQFLTHRFDLIFMDLQMPVMNGKQATQRIRELEVENQVLHRTPIIAVTGTEIPDKEWRFYADIGFDKFLLKPVSRDSLIDLLRDSVQESHNPIRKAAELNCN
ncbi:MAG: response regulator, partial [Planctomycetota bacterium]